MPLHLCAYITRAMGSRARRYHCKMSGQAPSVYVRDAHPSEFDYLARLETRAFANDPLMSYVGGLREYPKMPEEYDGPYAKNARALYFFCHSLLLSAKYTNGRILVVVEKAPDSEKGASERIVAGSVWCSPGAKLDGLWLTFRAMQYRVMIGTLTQPGGWGITGYKVRSSFVRARR